MAEFRSVFLRPEDLSCKRVQPIEEGDLVLVYDRGVPRKQWVPGRVLKISIYNNGVRTVELRTSSETLKRPASKVAPLNVDVSKTSLAIYRGRHIKETGDPAKKIMRTEITAI